MKKKFLMITPRNISPYGTIPRVHPPLGAISILSQLKQDGYDVKLLDTSLGQITEETSSNYFERMSKEVYFDGVKYWKTGLDDDEILDRIKQYAPDLIGFSCCTVVDRMDTKHLIELIKMHFPAIPVILGGHEASHNYKGILIKKLERDYIYGVDCISLYLGQPYITKIASYMLNKSNFEHNTLPPGMAIVINGKIKTTGQITFNVNDYALIDYSLLDKVYIKNRIKPMDIYSYIGNTHAGNIKELNKNKTEHTSYFPIFTSYGCGYNCTFCDTDQYLLRYTAENTIKMIQNFEQNYGIDYIDFMDNNFAGGDTNSRNIAFKILEYIANKNYIIGFSNGLTFESMMRKDFELLRLFEKHNNVAHIAFPCENGNDRVLKMVRKPHTIKTIEKVLNFAKEHLKTTNKEGFFIGGFPETLGQEAETPQEVVNTINYIEYLLSNKLLHQAIFLKLSPVSSIYRIIWNKKHSDKSFVHCLFSKGTGIWPYDEKILEKARLDVIEINKKHSRKVTRVL